MRHWIVLLGFEVWNEGACPVQLIDHHRWERTLAATPLAISGFKSVV